MAKYGTVDGVEKITCSFCQSSGKSNGFTKGSTNFKRGAINEHSQCTDHTASVQAMQQQNAMKQHLDVAKQLSPNALISQLRVVYHMSRNAIPCHQFEGITELLKSGSWAC